MITENSRRKLWRIPHILVQPEWLEEMCVRLLNQRSHQWTGQREEYRWTAEIMDWMHERGGRFSLQRCRLISDFKDGTQAGIWFADPSRVTLFKLTFGGQSRPIPTWPSPPPHQYWSLGGGGAQYI